MPHLFCDATKSLWAQTTAIYDFLWPTAAAMWNLRWQVAGYLQSRPNADHVELRQRFVAGSDIWGANIRRACVDHTWEQQTEQFADFLLVNLFSNYEGWVGAILEETGAVVADERKCFQFPSRINKHGINFGLAADLEAFQPESSWLCCTVYPAMTAQKKYSMSVIENLMLCYRYFKECRNARMHQRGLATERTVAAWKAFEPVATMVGLDVAEVPVVHPIANGKRVQLSLRGVVGFCDIVLRIATTIDFEITKSILAEKIFVIKWKKKYRSQKTLKANPAAMGNQISTLVQKLELPAPAMPGSLLPFLRKHRLGL